MTSPEEHRLENDLLREATLAICKLPDTPFQSMLNYASSRCRAIAFTYVMRRTALDEPDRLAFITQFQRELVSLVPIRQLQACLILLPVNWELSRRCGCNNP